MGKINTCTVVRCTLRLCGEGGPIALILLQAVAVSLASQQQVTAMNCVDLVADCGAKADNSTDDTVAFAVCQTLASKHSGCITVSAGHYRIAGVELNTSNIEIHVDNDAVFLFWNGSQYHPPALFIVGEMNPTSIAHVQNVSLRGQAPGMFTVDLSTALRNPWRLRAVAYFGGVRDFALANMLCKQADPSRNPAALRRGEFPCIAFNYETYAGHRLNPQDGIVQNLSCVGCVFGYGLVQMHSAERVAFANLYSEGGVTLRLETDDGTGGYLDGIFARNVTCKDGEAAVSTQPHVQQNGVFHVEKVLSLGCDAAVDVNGGYSQQGYPPGHFGNASTISGVVGVYGTHAQNSSLGVDVASCAPCVHHNVMVNYIVTVTGIQAVGFPPPANRTDCIFYKTFQGGCPYRH